MPANLMFWRRGKLTASLDHLTKLVTSWLIGGTAQTEGTSHIQKMRNNFQVLRYNHTVGKPLRDKKLI